MSKAKTAEQIRSEEVAWELFPDGIFPVTVITIKVENDLGYITTGYHISVGGSRRFTHVDVGELAKFFENNKYMRNAERAGLLVKITRAVNKIPYPAGW